MDDQVRILMLEDSPDDAMLVQRSVTKGGIQAMFNVVSSAPEFTRMLGEYSPDIVLSDHSMPMFNSVEALKLLQEHNAKSEARTPMILVTGSVSEEFAATCMRSGADDYVLKDKMIRLPEAIRSAIAKAKAENEQKWFLKTLIDREARMREAERLAQIGSMSIGIPSLTCQWSDEFHRILGYRPETTVPSLERLIDHVHPEDREVVRSSFDKALKNLEPMTAHFRIVRGDEVRYVYAHLANPYENGNTGETIDHMTCFVRDITTRRTAERLLEEAYRIARIGAWKYSLATKAFTWTAVTKEIHEVPPDFEPTLEEAIAFFKEGKNRETAVEIIKDAVSSGKAWDIELQIVTAKGNERWVRSRGEVEVLEGKPTRVFGSIQDIHNMKLGQLQVETQNSRLKEIAWIQSHEVRAPLARMLGLLDLIGKGDNLDHSLYKSAMEAARELDGIVRSVVRRTEEIGL